MNSLTGRLVGQRNYLWAGLWTTLLATSLLACSSKTSPEVRDASTGRDGAWRDSADGRVDESTLPDSAPPKGDAAADGLSPASSDARPDISDTSPASTDIVSIQPDMASADTGRFDGADAGTADLPSVRDGLADSLLLIDQTNGDQANRDVLYVADAHPADTRVGIDVVAVDGLAVGCNPVAPGAPISFKVPDGTGSEIIRYDVSGGKLKSVTFSYTPGGYGYSSPARSVVGAPDGTSIYYAGYCLDGTNLTVQRYAQTDQIISVTPSGTLAISSTKVHRVADGTALATLPSTCSVQAVSPDSKTLYCAGTSGITTFSLAGLQ